MLKQKLELSPLRRKLRQNVFPGDTLVILPTELIGGHDHASQLERIDNALYRKALILLPMRLPARFDRFESVGPQLILEVKLGCR